MATILVVDDDVPVMLTISELLRTQGHTVIPIHEALRASEMCRTYPDPIHLVITDIVMPGINGVALANELKAIRPELKVLYTSGYGDITLRDRGIAANLSILLKPCDAHDLFNTVQQALSSPSSPASTQG